MRRFGFLLQGFADGGELVEKGLGDEAGFLDWGVPGDDAAQVGDSAAVGHDLFGRESRVAHAPFGSQETEHVGHGAIDPPFSTRRMRMLSGSLTSPAV